MDIIVTKKQKEAMERAARARHAQRVRAGEEVLGLRKRNPSGKTTPQRHVRHTDHRAHRTHTFRRAFLAFLATIVVFGLGAFGYISAKAYFASTQMFLPTKHVTIKSTQQELRSPGAESTTTQTPPTGEKASFVRDTFSAATSLIGKRTPLRGESDGQINILLLGRGTPDHPGRDLTDTIMLAQINVVRGKIALFSLPRDLYVRIPGTKSATKINALYKYGIDNDRGADTIVAAVEEVTGLPVHYFLVADFDAFIAVVDALGGINVTVERKIYDTAYPGPNYSYETFTLEPGLTHLNGTTALKYVRSRHGDPEGDFGRAKRQQQVLQAIKNKALSIGTLSNPIKIGKLFDAMGAHIRTNMTMSDITSLVALSTQLDTHNITTAVVDAWKADSLLRVIHVGKMFALVPRAGRFTYTEIRKSAQTIFERPARERLLREIAVEKPTITIVRAGAHPKTAHRVQALVRDALALTQRDVRIARAQEDSRASHAIIIDRTDTAKPFTLTALINTLGAALASRNVPTQSADDIQKRADIIILLGTEADAFFRESEVSKEQFDTADLKDNEHVMILTED